MPLLETALAAGAIGSGLFNAAQTGRQNRKSREFSRETYAKQKQDSIEFWNMQNAYNSPEAQMQRLKDAGLNPNMIYGSSSGGASGTAENIKTPDTIAPQFRAPEITGMPQNLMTIYDMEIKQAQADNIKAQTTNTQEDTILKMLDQHGKGYDNASKEVKARLDSDLMEISAETAKERLRQLKIQNQYQLDETERAIILFEPRLQNSVEDILTKRLGREITRQQMQNLHLDQKVKELDARLTKMGIRPNDPFYAKAVASVIGFALQKLNIPTPY